jgi:uncharacterized membrane protein
MKLDNSLRVKTIVAFTLVAMLLVPLLVYKTTIALYSFSVEQQAVVDFLSGEETALAEGFTQAEADHLVDVSDVMQGIDYLIILLVVIGVLLSFVLYRKEEQKLFAAGLFYAGAAVCVLSFLVLLVAVWEFSGLFTQFHQLFFVDGTWVFPADSMIIQLFPFDFFSTITKSILMRTLFSGVLLLGAGYWLK